MHESKEQRAMKNKGLVSFRVLSMKIKAFFSGEREGEGAD
jgi:hypothetical protein